MRRLIRRHKLPKKEKTATGKLKEVLPTPEEIAERAAEVRAGWAPTDKRLVGAARRANWSMPVYSYSPQTGLFQPQN